MKEAILSFIMKFLLWFFIYVVVSAVLIIIISLIMYRLGLLDGKSEPKPDDDDQMRIVSQYNKEINKKPKRKS